MPVPVHVIVQENLAYLNSNLEYSIITMCKLHQDTFIDASSSALFPNIAMVCHGYVLRKETIKNFLIQKSPLLKNSANLLVRSFRLRQTVRCDRSIIRKCELVTNFISRQFA